MTSTYLRKYKEIVFPCLPTLRILKNITNPKDLGLFYLDKVWIALEVPWRFEDIIGKSRGSEACVDEAGHRIGTIHHRELNGYRFQIFIGKGRVRNLQFNPRHFKSLDEFISFVRLVIAGRPYHITHIDFSWLLYKSIFSVIFLFWSLRVKSLQLNAIYDYVTEGLKILSKGSFQGFSYGIIPIHIKVYDTDDLNTTSERRPEFKVHDCINLEVGLNQIILKINGIRKLNDLRELSDFSWVLKTFNFVKPSRGRFRNTKFEYLQDVWKEEGATEMARQLYEVTKARRRKVILKYVDRLLLKEMSFKCGLIELANADYERFKKGLSQVHRKKVRSVQIDMEPFFKKKNTVVLS